jgi:hypothetical protein
VGGSGTGANLLLSLDDLNRNTPPAPRNPDQPPPRNGAALPQR